MFDLIILIEMVCVEMKFIGKFSVYNVLVVMVLCLVLGIFLLVIVEEIKVLEGVSGCFEVVDVE